MLERLINKNIDIEYHNDSLSPKKQNRAEQMSKDFQINEPEKIYEVDFDTFKSVNKLNQTGINGFIYRRAHLEWKLVGDTNIVRALNQKAITEVEKTIPGLSTYLFSNPYISKQIHSLVYTVDL